MVKDLRVPADAETGETRMTTASANAIELEAKVTDIETAQTERWLAKTLAPARRAAGANPSDEAIARMRLRVLGEDAGKAARAPRRIAA